ncbi:hypothetical protein H0H92_009995 [Tricholoma furcatifolium]|nr:hypothetical protein H0H92_009995 [Tricholoma furcatifolium]
MKPLVAKQVFETMKSQGVRGDKEYLKKYHAERSIAALKEIQKGLFKKYKCSPLPTILVPVAAQLPVFVIGSVMLARLSQDPTPFDSESFLTLTTLAHTDSTMTFPIVLGILAMANVESRSNWFLNAAEKEQARKVEEQRAKALAESKEMKLRPANMIKPILRVASVVRIGLCALVPGSVAIYWVTSAAFGLGQTWVMDWLDIRRRRRNAAAQAPSAQPMPAMQPTPSSSPILKSKLKRRS